ncbi:MAG: crossover junction endodeoxyribonuclease RuvC [Patescibacteria group bacterium]|nr:crossover junction endodeoxyribonuclease RuvC [Patescibacteria group bacterium]
MIIIGIDPGTARMGYGVIEKTKGKRIKLLESDTLVTTPKLELQDRLNFLYNRLSEVVVRHSPDVMVIEKLFFNTNAKTAIAVGQARGINMLVAAKKRLKVYEYTALQAKKCLTGYGRADKKEMQKAVMERLGLEKIVKSDDANDGVAMALCFIEKDYDVLSKDIK